MKANTPEALSYVERTVNAAANRHAQARLSAHNLDINQLLTGARLWE